MRSLLGRVIEGIDGGGSCYSSLMVTVALMTKSKMLVCGLEVEIAGGEWMDDVEAGEDRDEQPELHLVPPGSHSAT